MKKIKYITFRFIFFTSGITAKRKTDCFMLSQRRTLVKLRSVAETKIIKTAHK